MLLNAHRPMRGLPTTKLTIFFPKSDNGDTIQRPTDLGRGKMFPASCPPTSAFKGHVGYSRPFFGQTLRNSMIVERIREQKDLSPGNCQSSIAYSLPIRTLRLAKACATPTLRFRYYLSGGRKIQPELCGHAVPVGESAPLSSFAAVVNNRHVVPHF
jgi:hypothetical protein